MSIKIIDLESAKQKLIDAERDANWHNAKFDSEFAGESLDFVESYFTKEDLSILYYSLVNLSSEFNQPEKIKAIEIVKGKISAILN